MKLMKNRWALNAQFLLAIQNNDVSKASQLFTQGVDTDTRFHSYKKPALCLCVENDDIQMVELLLQEGASVNQCDEDGESPLHIACKYGFMSVVQILMRFKANPCTKNRMGMTPLHYAAETGKVDLLNLLIARGSDKEALNFLGQTPLHLACQHQDSRGVRFLLAAGSNAKFMDKRGNTPLHYAVATTGTDVDGIEALAIQNPFSSLVGNASKKTPLHIVVGSCRSDAPQALKAMLRRLPISTSINYPLALSPKTERGHTPLHMAVLEKNSVMTRILVSAGSRVDTRDQLGRTPLECAVRDSDPDIVAILLSAGASTRRIMDPNYPVVTEEKIKQLIQFSAKHAMPLASLCRRTLATNFGPVFQGSLNEIPWTLKSFMEYIDL